MGTFYNNLAGTTRSSFRIGGKGLFDGSGLTALRTYALPDSSGTLLTDATGAALGAASNSFTGFVEINGGLSVPAGGVVVNGGVVATSLSGDGNAVTNLNASNVGGGTLPSFALPAFTGDVTSVGATDALTIATNAVTVSKLATLAGLSVLGRSANSTGNVAAITGTAGQTLRVSGTTLGFGALDLTSSAAVTGALRAGCMPALTGDISNTAGSLTTAIGANKVTVSQMATLAGLSVLGRSANSTGNVAAVTGTAGQVLRVSGTTLGFGTVDLTDANAVTGVLRAGSAPILTGHVLNAGGVSETVRAVNLTVNPFRRFPRQVRTTLTGWANNTYGPTNWYQQTDSASIQCRGWLAGDSSPPVAFSASPAYLQWKNNGAGAAGMAIIQVIEAAGPMGVSAFEMRSLAVASRMMAIASTGTPTLKCRIYEWTGTADSSSAKSLIASWSANVPTFNTTTLSSLGAGSAALNSSTWTAVGTNGTASSSANNLVVIWWVEGLAAGASLYLCNPFFGRGSAAPTTWAAHEDDGELCDRYVFASVGGNNWPGYAPGAGMGRYTFTHPTGLSTIPIRFPVPMRTTPGTFTSYDNAGNAGKISYFNGAWTDNQAPTAVTAYDNGGGFVQQAVVSAYYTSFDLLASAEI